MKGRAFFHNPFKRALVKLIRSTLMDNDTIRRAYMSLTQQDRDCMPYVPRLLAIESRYRDMLCHPRRVDLTRIASNRRYDMNVTGKSRLLFHLVYRVGGITEAGFRRTRGAIGA